ncbi:hypothetical protein GCM10022377_23940 [Zhihengliuella alba]|uniref:Uncharacterized protein n=1 Tax=Zhihengliuella alba TaxID=547018 RepID=A0ABP7DXV0_9MICC
MMLVLGAAFAGLGYLNYRGVWRPWNVVFPYFGSGMLFTGAAVLLWGCVSLVTGAVSHEGRDSMASALQWTLSGLGFVALLLFAAGVWFGYGHLPRALRPRWVREGEGIADVTTADGTSVPLPEWSAARAGTALAGSRGPILGPAAVDWLYRNWMGHGWKRFAQSAESEALRDRGMLDGDGRAVPEVHGAAMPLRRAAANLYVAVSRPIGSGPADEHRDFILRADETNGVVLWQEDWWPGDQRALTDERSVQQRLRLMATHGTRRKVNTPYRLDFIDPASTGRWAGDFLRDTEAPGAVWRAFVDGELWGTIERQPDGSFTVDGRTVEVAALERSWLEALEPGAVRRSS